jgi:ABC-type proline/glycine betaine transport system permease subunit
LTQQIFLGAFFPVYTSTLVGVQRVEPLHKKVVAVYGASKFYTLLHVVIPTVLPDILGGSGRLLYVPSGYTSNSVISGTSTYNSTTIAGMGLTPGTYTWSWGSGGDASTLVMTIS